MDRDVGNSKNEAEIIHVYTDGACTQNGRHGARAGIGVYFPHGHDRKLNVSERLRETKVTNNIAELRACKRAIEIVIEIAEEKKRSVPGFEKINLLIHTDSEYVVNCMEEYIQQWRNNDWKTLGSDRVVKNQKLLEAIEKLCNDELVKVEWEHVERNSCDGNIIADDLAVKGRNKAWKCNK